MVTQGSRGCGNPGLEDGIPSGFSNSEWRAESLGDSSIPGLLRRRYCRRRATLSDDKAQMDNPERVVSVPYVLFVPFDVVPL